MFSIFVLMCRSSKESKGDTRTEAFDWFELKHTVDKKQSLPCKLLTFKNWFMLSVHISSYGCMREVWRAQKKRKSCSRRSREQL